MNQEYFAYTSYSHAQVTTCKEKCAHFCNRKYYIKCAFGSLGGVAFTSKSKHQTFQNKKKHKHKPKTK